MRDERQAALEVIASEVRACTRCRLHETRTRAVPGEGDPDTEVVFVGEGPGMNEDREGRPFVGRAGGLLVRLLASIGWQRDDVFITNVVKCRPPDNRDPEPDEIAACAPYLRRQLEVLDPAVVVTLGRFSMQAFIPGARIGQVHGTTHPVDPGTGAPAALAFAMYHPAAALRSSGVEQTSFEDVSRVPSVLLRARELRAGSPASASAPTAASASTAASTAAPPVTASTSPAGDVAPASSRPAAARVAVAAEPVPVPDDASQLTLF
jgi:uracil-DNA glycosylase